MSASSSTRTKPTKTSPTSSKKPHTVPTVTTPPTLSSIIPVSASRSTVDTPESQSSTAASSPGSHTLDDSRSDGNLHPSRSSCKITLKDGNINPDDPIMETTTPHPPPPPPPAGAALVGSSAPITPQSTLTMSPPNEQHAPTDSNDDSDPPGVATPLKIRIPPTSTNDVVVLGHTATDNSQPADAAAALKIRIPATCTRDVITVGADHSGTSSTSSSPTVFPHHNQELSGPAQKLAQKLDYARISATANPYYLALGESVRAQTAWIRDGRANILVAKDAAKTVTNALAAHAADPTIAAEPDMPSPVPCAIIGTIDTEHCFLRADGNFRGFNPALSWQKKFSQTTLSFALGPPPSAYPTLVKDFHTGLATFDTILPKNANLKSGQYAQGFGSKHLRLRHVVFAPRSNASEDNAENPDAGLPPDFTIYQWPTYSTEAADALAAIAHSHVARPLPAYDLRGDLIPPAQYSLALRGATVLVSFNVAHYSITDKRMNGTETTKQQICLDVQYIRVLIPPPHSSAFKRTPVHLTDPYSHAAKKMRQS